MCGSRCVTSIVVIMAIVTSALVASLVAVIARRRHRKRKERKQRALSEKTKVRKLFLEKLFSELFRIFVHVSLLFLQQLHSSGQNLFSNATGALESGNDVTGSIRYAASGFNIQMKVGFNGLYLIRTVSIDHHAYSVCVIFSRILSGRSLAQTSCWSRFWVKVSSERSFARMRTTCRADRACALLL